METKTLNLEQIYKELMILKEEMECMKAVVSEDFEVANDVLEEIEESRKRSGEDFISHGEMRKEFE